MARLLGRTTMLFAGGFFIAFPANARPSDDVRRGFDRFVAAQNAHDLDAVRGMFGSGPGFVWVTRGNVVKGRAAAIDRFRDLYRGTWHLQPTAPPETFVIDSNTVQLVAAVTFTVGPPGSAPTETRFMLTQLWHRHNGRWQVASLLPISLPAN